MSLAIVITHLGGGTLQGQKKYPATQITLGRSRENDVVFDPHRDPLVSGKHAAISIHEGRLWLRDLGSSNGTFLNGVRISAVQVVQPGDQITLGHEGPRLGASLLDERAAVPPPPPRSSSPSEKRPKRRWSSRGESSRTRGIGMQTLQNIVLKATQKERRRTRRLLLLVIVILGGGGAAVAWKFWPKGSTFTTHEKVVHETTTIVQPSADQIFPKLFKKVRPSVYAVLSKSRIGNTTLDKKGGGTAWVVAPGVLATNVHVARPFLPSAENGHKGKVLIARSATDPPHDLRIVGVTLHPGYESLSQMRWRYRPFDKSDFAWLRLPPSCDVALMRVHDDDRDKMGAPLTLASKEELQSLSPGEPLAYMGFPVESMMAGTMARPAPETDIGALSKTTDFFLERNSPERELFVHNTFRIEGGASGSPVFNTKGQVVAVVNAANFKFIGGQRISQGVTSFAQRADLVYELLEKRADRAQRKRDAQWRETFTRLWRDGHGDPLLRYMHNVVVPEAFKTKKPFLSLLVKKRGSFRSSADVKTFQFRLKRNGPWCAIAIAGAETPVGMSFERPTKTTRYSTVRFTGNRGKAGDRLRLSIYPSPKLSSKAEFTIHFLQQKP